MREYDYENYFFNDLYDEELIATKINDWQNRDYRNIMMGKDDIQKIRVLNGDANDIVQNQDRNLQFGLPMNTYSIALRFNIIPYYSEKAFYDHYGYETLISSIDIMKDQTIFSNNLFFFVNGYMIHNIKIVAYRDRSYLFFPYDNDLTESDFERILTTGNDRDDTWTIYLQEKSDFYLSGKVNINSLFTASGKVDLSVVTRDSMVFDKRFKNNCWTAYFSCSDDSGRIMKGTTAGVEEGTTLVTIPSEFRTAIQREVEEAYFLLVNEPSCIGSGVFINSSETDAYINIPFEKNPIPKENLTVWQYDNTTKWKRHPISMKAIDPPQYPNIYDFNPLLKGDFYNNDIRSEGQTLRFDHAPANPVYRTITDREYSLYIQWQEPMDDPSAYDSYIEDYMDCYADDYVSMTVNDQLPQVIKDFDQMIPLNVTSEDFVASGTKDYRYWKLLVLDRFFEKNPGLYAEYFKQVYKNIRRFTTKSYTMTDDCAILSRSILNNEAHVGEHEELLVSWNVPHTYIHLYDYCDETRPIEFFINGIKHEPDHILKLGTNLYIYFPTSWITEGDIIQIEIPMYNHDVMDKEFNFTNLGASVDFDALHLYRDIDLANVIFTVKETGEYIRPFTEIDVIGQFAISQIYYRGMTIPVILLKGYDSKYIKPTDAKWIVVRIDEIPLELEHMGHKIINLDHLEIYIHGKTEADPATIKKLLRKPLRISSGDFFETRRFTTNDEYLETNTLHSYAWVNFTGYPNKNRFRVYSNGKRISGRDISVVFTTYNGQAQITWVNNVEKDTPLCIEYIGYDEEVALEKYISEVYSNGIFDLRELPLPFDLYQYSIYIDGIRIPDSCIHKIGKENMLIIDKDVIDYTQNQNVYITIYGQSHDEDVYDFNVSRQFISQLIQVDSNFRDYMKNAYD